MASKVGAQRTPPLSLCPPFARLRFSGHPVAAPSAGAMLSGTPSANPPPCCPAGGGSGGGPPLSGRWSRPQIRTQQLSARSRRRPAWRGVLSR